MRQSGVQGPRAGARSSVSSTTRPACGRLPVSSEAPGEDPRGRRRLELGLCQRRRIASPRPTSAFACSRFLRYHAASGAHRAARAGELGAGVVEQAVDRARRPQRRPQLARPAPAHQRVQVEVPAVEPVAAVLRRGDRRVGARYLLRVPALQLLETACFQGARTYQSLGCADPCWKHQLAASVSLNRCESSSPSFHTSASRSSHSSMRAAGELPPGARVLDVGAGDAPFRELFAHTELHHARLGAVAARGRAAASTSSPRRTRSRCATRPSTPCC